MDEDLEVGHVRRARPDDARRCRDLYAPFVETTVISLEEEPPSVQEMRDRITRSLQTHDWLVLDGPDGIVGYAYAGEYRSRAAYRWACEVSVYVEPGRRRTGAGRTLYDALFSSLVDSGYLTALAGMTLPNEASEGLHRALGFEPVGTWRRIGWKFGSWHDVLWMQRHLAPGSEPPAEPDRPPQTSR
ncbi:MAG: N-acetyltransferase family protein [Marmoricola sp.]